MGAAPRDAPVELSGRSKVSGVSSSRRAVSQLSAGALCVDPIWTVTGPGEVWPDICGGDGAASLPEAPAASEFDMTGIPRNPRYSRRETIER